MVLGVDWRYIREEVAACLWWVGRIVIEQVLYKTRRSLA
jgi:hypothetical protein